VRARKAAQEAIRVNESQYDQTEIVKLLEEEMLQAAQNLEFERAAQLRDKINEMKGAPTIKSGNSWRPGPDGDGEADGRQKIWQPKTPARHKRAAR
jgi:excinuclease ABC subunit B